MKKCTIILKDFVNVKLEGLPPELRQKIHKELKFMVPYARHTPQFKLKRWDGKVAFATLGGNTYINLLDKVIPILVKEGYEVDIDDQRPDRKFDFKEIDENFLSDYTWNKDHIYANEPIILMDHQVNAVNAYLKNHQSLISAATSAGKCQPLFSKIKTPNGWTNFANIKVNDEVVTPDGSIARVLNVYDPGIKDVYELTFSDGRIAHCCEDHIWKIKEHSATNTSDWKLCSTKDIIEKKKTHKVSIPLVTMQNDNQDKDFLIHPMLMGLLLTNSYTHDPLKRKMIEANLNIHMNFKLEKELRKIVKPNHKVYITNQNDIYISDKPIKIPELTSTLFRLEKSLYVNSKFYENALNHYGIMINGFDTDYFIPDDYKNGSYEQRLDFLRGFFLSYDCVVSEGKIHLKDIISKKFIADLSYMIRSIGGSVKCVKNLNKKKGRKSRKLDYYQLLISHNDPSLFISSIRPIKYKKNNDLFITKIKKLSKMPVRCIMIDDPNHLYVTNDFIVTHNTIITSCCSKLIEQTTGGRTITIVPSITLVRQTEVDYLNVGLDTGVYFGEEKNYDNQHILTTWQSMVSLSKSAKENIEARDRLNRLLYNVDMVMVDECHTIKGQELKELLCNDMSHIPIRWGLTGTIPKDEYSIACLNSSIGDVVYSISAKELQDKGIISKCHIDIMKLVDDAEFSSYEEEKDYIISDKERTQWLLDFCTDLSKKGNTLVLVDSLDLGKKLSSMVPNSFFIYGLIHNDKRLAEFKKMSTNNNLLLFASFQTSSTGISAVRIFNIVLVSAGRSFTRCIQSIGRGLRKGGDKDFINIYDITSTLKFESKQLTTRKSYYKEAQYPFTEHKIKYK